MERCAPTTWKRTVGREKTPYSIWQKMQRNNLNFEQLCDIMAFRLIVPTQEDCYRGLGIVHGAYPVIPGRSRITFRRRSRTATARCIPACSVPSGSGSKFRYAPSRCTRLPSTGVAAHWHYKRNRSTKRRPYRWLRELLEILEHAGGPEEFLEHTKLEMFQDEVFCFTPKGDLINLPTGATRSTSLTPCTQKSAISAWEPRSTAV